MNGRRTEPVTTFFEPEDQVPTIVVALCMLSRVIVCAETGASTLETRAATAAIICLEYIIVAVKGFGGLGWLVGGGMRDLKSRSASPLLRNILEMVRKE